MRRAACALEGCGHRAWQRHVARLAAFRQPKYKLAADDLELALDMQGVVWLVDVVPDPQLAAVPDLIVTVEAVIGDIAVAVYR